MTFTPHIKWNKVYRIQDKLGGTPHIGILLTKHKTTHTGTIVSHHLFVRVLPHDRFVSMSLLEGQQNFNMLGVADSEDEAERLCEKYEEIFG